MRPSEFLRLLWGDRPPGLVQLWQLAGKRSHYLRTPQSADDHALGATDLYTSVGLAARDHGRHRRARAHEVVAIAGLWLDVDVAGGPGGKRDAAPSAGAALALTLALAPPTIVVNSGHGLHAWHLLDRPWRFADRDEQRQAARAAARWQALHRAAARERGWTLDATHDLARLLRLPGTVNGKGGARRAVHVVVASGQRLPRARLLELATEQAAAERAAGAQRGGRRTPTLAGTPRPAADAAVDARVAERLRALLASSPAFADAWRHRRPETAGWSTSEHDLSIARRLVAAGWEDGDVACAIALHRRRHAPGDPKAARGDYLARTVAKAHEPSVRDRARAQLQRLAEASEA